MQDNKFSFAQSRHLDQVTALQAQMTDFTYSRHAHEEYAFGITLAGCQEFYANGGFHRSYPGNVFVFNPDVIHDGQSGGDDTLLYRMLYVHPDQFQPLLISAGVKQSNQFRLQNTLIDDTLLHRLIYNMVLIIEDGESDALTLEHSLFAIAERIAQHQGICLSDQRSRKIDTLLFKAREYIHSNIHGSLSLEGISQHVNLSKYHFLRMFRQQFGITPHQYILNYRINQARKSLESGASLNDVVFQFGFSDLSHFNRVFKPVFGMTPRQYQQYF